MCAATGRGGTGCRAPATSSCIRVGVEGKGKGVEVKGKGVEGKGKNMWVQKLWPLSFICPPLTCALKATAYSETWVHTACPVQVTWGAWTRRRRHGT